ncbi:tetratricopeptide (TPR) repeat protein/predicted Ser/Thr protein kinase [Pseudoxanthomonas broegbernensis]|nr:serine/threonine-protein kinase [Pseudoxanthomonas broegbernensis]MBB6064011.1 tetratricopeptide (TPR) repeat protein/predicted Ser/Thr protein kinase [Pseudoxanthomonas broegbernensis]
MRIAMVDGEAVQGGGRFGRFERLSPLGAGGHGTVWLARQAEPQRTVALKILNGSLAGGELQQRFRREVELLAMLEHPGIARLYDSGTVDGPTGPVPWLAMEYVEGRPLNAWAAAAPAPAQRVRLLESLCRAVHFAHTRGVIHRDLKPSNILVDAQDRPHIIDFGIAAALERGDLTRMTAAGAVLGTLPYMSPEQLDGSAATDPRWDVYALGVIAYELLGGALPYPGLAEATSVVAAMRIVATRDPVPLGRIAPAARGELETVAMKAIAHDPADRYGSAAELADDLRRWLEGRPVEAAPPGAWRVLRLFVRRHRALSWAVAAVAATLVAATAVSTRMALAEADARRNAELRLAERDSVNAFLTDMLLSADPEHGAGSDIRVREWLATTNAGYQSRAATLPAEVRHSLARTLGTALLHLGEPALAGPRLDEAQALAAQLHGARAPATLAVAIEAARAKAEADPDAAETLLRALLDDARATGDANGEVEAGIALGSHLESLGRIDDAFAVSERTVARARAALGTDAPATLSALHNHAALLKYRGDFAAAEPLARDVYDRRLAALGAGHPLTLYSHNQLGGILDRLGRTEEAEAIYRQTWAARRESLGERHPSSLVTLNNLSALLIQRGALEEAGPLLDTLVAATGERFGADAPRTLMAMNQRAYALEDLGRLDEAEAQLRTIVATLDAQGGDVHPERLAPRSNLAMLLSKRGKHGEATATMRAVVEAAAGALGDDHPYVGIFRSNYGEILTHAGRNADALRELRKAQAVLEARLGPEHARVQKNRQRLIAAGGSA